MNTTIGTIIYLLYVITICVNVYYTLQLINYFILVLDIPHQYRINIL